MLLKFFLPLLTLPSPRIHGFYIFKVFIIYIFSTTTVIHMLILKIKRQHREFSVAWLCIQLKHMNYVKFLLFNLLSPTKKCGNFLWFSQIFLLDKHLHKDKNVFPRSLNLCCSAENIPKSKSNRFPFLKVINCLRLCQVLACLIFVWWHRGWLTCLSDKYKIQNYEIWIQSPLF